jgi:hypothetical protein
VSIVGEFALPPLSKREVPMPDLTEPDGIHFDGAASSLEEQLALAQKQVNEQRQAIANLLAESFEAGAARIQLLSLLENLAFLRKLSSA